MLAFSSDMSVPKDITAVGLYIRTKSGTVLYNNVVEATVSATGDRSVRLPASFAVLSNGSPATVKVQLIAYGTKRKPFVIRQATTSVPVNRLSVLRMPLLWLNQHSADTANGVVVPTNANTSGQLNVASLLSGQVADDFALPEGGFKLPCANDDESFIGGKCVTVDPNAQLPDFDPTEDPNSPDGACFSVEACFSKAASVRERIQKDGKIDLTGFDLSSINLALVTKDGAGIALGDGRFAISLDSGSELEGFFVKNGALYLSSAVMHALDSGLATDIVATTSCAQKTLDVGNCGPWNPAKTPLSSNRSDGGIPSLDAAPRTDGATADADASTLDASDAGSLDGSTDGATDASA